MAASLNLAIAYPTTARRTSTPVAAFPHRLICWSGLPPGRAIFDTYDHRDSHRYVSLESSESRINLLFW
jgi:hypothetical protein